MAIVEYWASLDVAVQSALIGAAATFAAAMVGFGAIARQIGAQGRQSRDAVAENERRRIKAAIFEDAVSLCRELSDAASAFSNTILIMDISLDAASKSASAGLPYNLPVARFPGVSAEHRRFSDAAISVIFLIENRLIVDSRLLVFRSALSSVLHDAREIMFKRYVPALLMVLPIDSPTGGTLPYNPPTEADLAPLHVENARMMEALGDASAYAEDLIAALQNLLLGDLFKHRVAARLPIDPRKKAITLEACDELESWFRTETTWGRETARIEAETRQRFGVV